MARDLEALELCLLVTMACTTGCQYKQCAKAYNVNLVMHSKSSQQWQSIARDDS